jgi:peptide/nickel transport system ATP-binding protein
VTPPQRSAELVASGLRVEFTTRAGRVAKALDGADLVVRAGEVVALVGESGSGKTTLARSLVGLTKPAAGEVTWDGKPMNRSARGLKSLRRQVQLVLQDPSGALNPRQTVYESVAEGLRVHKLVARSGKTEDELVAAALSSAGLRPPEGLFLRYPHELSGGQRQRVLIAGALAVQPQLLIADEPVSSLDASIRGEILALLLRLREELGLGVLVVTHDLGLAWNIADRIAVMYLGRVVESGPTEEVLTSPQHPLHPGSALGRARDGASRADRAPGRDPGPDAHPARMPFPPALSGPGVGRGRRGRGRLPTHVAADPPQRPRRPSLCLPPGCVAGSGRRGGRGERVTLQAALPRELYVDAAAWERERDQVLLREWTCVGRVADLGLHEPERVAIVEALGESLVVTSDADGALHAAYNVCRHRGSQLFPTEPGSAPQLCAAKSIRCPYHSWTYALDGSLLRAPHTEDGDVDPPEFGLHTVGAEAWGGFVFVHPTAHDATPLVDSVGRATRTLANYDLDSLVTGLALTYEVACQLEGDRRELQRVLPLRAGAPRAVAAGSVVRGRRARPRLGRRDPAPRGRLDVHDDRHHRSWPPCPASTSTRGRGTRASWSIPT